MGVGKVCGPPIFTVVEFHTPPSSPSITPSPQDQLARTKGTSTLFLLFNIELS